MFWILQAIARLQDWWAWVFGLRDSYFLATLEDPDGRRFQVPVVAPDYDDAYDWLAQHYPQDEIIDVQLQRWG
jgi:hypothetical protein